MDVASCDHDEGEQLLAVTASVSCSLNNAYREGARPFSACLAKLHLDRAESLLAQRKLTSCSN